MFFLYFMPYTQSLSKYSTYFHALYPHRIPYQSVGYGHIFPRLYVGTTSQHTEYMNEAQYRRNIISVGTYDQ